MKNTNSSVLYDQPCHSAMSRKDNQKLRGVVGKRLIGVYRRAKVKLKRTPSETDSVAPHSDSNSEPEEVMYDNFYIHIFVKSSSMEDKI